MYYSTRPQVTKVYLCNLAIMASLSIFLAGPNSILAVIGHVVGIMIAAMAGTVTYLVISAPEYLPRNKQLDDTVWMEPYVFYFPERERNRDYSSHR